MRLRQLLLCLTAAAVLPPHDVPPAAYSVGAAYDAGRERVVIFGGYLHGQYLGDTWEWDGTGWTRSEGPGPSARNSPQLAYDECRKRVVMFGGDSRAAGAGEFGDTWERDGTRWRQVATTGPPSRTLHAMTYDSRRRRVVLFGGAAAGKVLGDTWEWDGERWTLVASGGPPARALHALAYDVARARVVLFGGTSAVAPGATSFGDTWEWDGTTWTQVRTPAPSARDHAAMVYDPLRHAIVLHGGGQSGEEQGETWSYDGRSWSRIAMSGPERMSSHLLFDSRLRVLLLYGGFDQAAPANDLWRLNAATWELITIERR